MSEAKSEASALTPLLGDFDVFVKQQDLQPDEGYDDPNGSEWVIGVDAWGALFVVQHPNLAPEFLDYKNAEEIGIGYSTKELDTEREWKPGLYKIKMAFRVHYHGEYGNDEEWLIEPISIEPYSA